MSKHDLEIHPPLMNAAGTLGFSPDLHSGMEWSTLGAFVTNPISLEPRTPAHGRRFASYPGGFVLHTGYPNPGFSQVLRRYARHWSRSPLPVIVHLLGRDAEEIARMAQRLESIEGVMGLEVGVVSDASRDQVAGFAQAASGELPVIMRLPMERCVELAQGAVNAGAMAISLAPPRGLYPTGGGEIIQGRLYGPAILPMALNIVRELTQLGIPTVGGGGIYTQAHKDAMLAAGAMAVQLDSALWRGGGYHVLI